MESLKKLAGIGLIMVVVFGMQFNANHSHSHISSHVELTGSLS